jgi:hypothetical protein
MYSLKKVYSHLLFSFEQRRYLTQLRISCHQLKIETGRYQGTLLQDRKCERCSSCYFMFFRINVAIVVRTDFSSVFINQTSLSFEFKRLKLGQLFAISLSRRFRSLYQGTLLQLTQRSNAHINFYLV